MARYSAFLGRRVEVHYRVGDILLPASGTFVADSGRSVFLEQHLTQHGQEKNFRWEIPYQYIVRLEEVKDQPPIAAGKSDTPPPKIVAAKAGLSVKDRPSRDTSDAAGASGGSSSILSTSLPTARPPKIA
jgi:hypothetical protein